MAEAYDPITKQAVKPRDLSPAEKFGIVWADIAMEIQQETGIPRVTYAYFDTTNTFEIRLRGRPDQFMRTEFGDFRLLQKGKFAALHKNFEFKGEGRTPWPTRAEAERWITPIIKWARSLDGKAELDIADGKKDVLEIPAPPTRGKNDGKEAAKA